MFWKKRKNRNRRLTRNHVLDVKVRSSVAAKARARMAAVTIGVVCGTILCLFALWCGWQWALQRFVYENRSFAIQNLDIQTDGVISVDQLRRWSQVKPGQNLFALRLESVKRDLEMVPMIQSVSLERVLPGTLRIRVTEREPIAQINVPRRESDSDGIEFTTYYLDAEGFVIQPLDPRQRAVPDAADDAFPVISGINLNDAAPGRQLDSPQVKGALKLIRSFESSPMASLVDLKRIDLSSPQVLVLTTGQGSEITFGLNDFDGQLLRWQLLQQQCSLYGKSIATLDLAVIQNPPLRTQEAAVQPPAPSHKSKPSPRPRRRNV